MATHPGPLGWISPADRTPDQHDAHIRAQATVPPLARFALPMPALQAGQAVRLFDFWKHPDVVADVGFVFDRFHQLTGSCVNCGGANGLFSTIAAQRVAAVNPTKAFLPFTWHNYAMSRHYMGDDGQGEGSLGSTFAKSLSQDGIRDWPKSGAGLPSWTDQDGISITSRDEMTWSSYRNPALQVVLAAAKDHKVASAAQCSSAADIRAAILNGYGVTFACNNYIGHASVQGSGADACVVGYWDGRGGHQQSLHAVWDHPSLGPLYWAQNNWPGSTYPADPAGGPVCGCWVTEAHVEAAMRLDGEVYALSNLAWFPATPAVLDWSTL
jgi:hypothetical protein